MNIIYIKGSDLSNESLLMLSSIVVNIFSLEAIFFIKINHLHKIKKGASL